MKKSKKAWRMLALILGMLLALAFVLTFAACGEEGESQSGGQPDQTDEQIEQIEQNEQNEQSSSQDNNSSTQDSQSSLQDVVPGATDMTPSADQHDESAETDYEFFYNMVESLFSLNYAAVADDLKFSEPSYNTRYADRFTLNGTAYASYDEKDGLIMYTPGVELLCSSRSYNSSYEDEIYGFSFYGDGSDFYLTYEESDYYPYAKEDKTDTYERECYRMSYEYFLDYEIEDGLYDYLGNIDKQTVQSTIDVACSILTEFLAKYFFEGVTMKETAFGYELDVDFEKMKEANDALFHTRLSVLIEDMLGDDFDNILASLEKLFNEKVEDAVDAVLKYGEDYGVTKDLVDEIFYLFTEYNSLDEFVEDFDGKNETVAEAFGFNTYQVLRDIEWYADMSFYGIILDGDFEYTSVAYDNMCKNFDAVINTDTSLVLNTYEDGTLISIEFESSGVTIGDYCYGDFCIMISGHAIVFFDAEMPAIESAPAKTAVVEYIDEFEGWLKDAMSDGGEYVFSSGNNYKYYATFENGEVMINCTYNGTTESVPLADIDDIEFSYYYNRNYISVRICQYFENYGYWRSFSVTMYLEEDKKESGVSD